MRLEVKNDLEKIDKEIRESTMRKQKGYVIKGYVNRKLKTVYGDIDITRTKFQYYDKAENKYKPFIY